MKYFFFILQILVYEEQKLKFRIKCSSNDTARFTLSKNILFKRILRYYSANFYQSADQIEIKLDFNFYFDNY